MKKMHVGIAALCLGLLMVGAVSFWFSHSSTPKAHALAACDAYIASGVGQDGGVSVAEQERQLDMAVKEVNDAAAGDSAQWSALQEAVTTIAKAAKAHRYAAVSLPFMGVGGAAAPIPSSCVNAGQRP